MERDMLPPRAHPHAHGVPWIEQEVEDAASSWTREATADSTKNDVVDIAAMGGPLTSSFKSMLESDWFIHSSSSSNINNNNIPSSISHHHDLPALPISNNPQDSTNAFSDNFLLNPIDSSSSSPLFFPPKSYFPSLFTPNPFDINNASFLDLPSDSSFLPQFHPNHSSNNYPLLMNFSSLNNTHPPMIGNLELTSNSDFPPSRLLPAADNAGGFAPPSLDGFDGSASALFSKSRVLRPLDVCSQQPTLFQKRAALRQAAAGGGDKLGTLEISAASRFGDYSTRKRKVVAAEEGEIEEASFDASGLNYDSDELNENSKVDHQDHENGNDGGSNSNANSTVTGGGGGGDHKGKKKGLPAKNLMAERRRRKKLNDRLYMLRSVVPKISKMDRASILGDAIDYLKELLQRINDLHNELESTPPGSLLPPPPPPPSANFHPLTPTLPALPCRVKEELCPSSMPSPKNQPARVEVRLREGRAVNIHMFCGRRPGILLSAMRALDSLGLDVQQAVISCFNGFALDVFRAEQCREGQDVPPEQIKAVLLDSAGCHGMM